MEDRGAGGRNCSTAATCVPPAVAAHVRAWMGPIDDQWWTDGPKGGGFVTTWPGSGSGSSRNVHGQTAWASSDRTLARSNGGGHLLLHLFLPTPYCLWTMVVQPGYVAQTRLGSPGGAMLRCSVLLYRQRTAYGSL
jgi:hypothetical protein